MQEHKRMHYVYELISNRLRNDLNDLFYDHTHALYQLLKDKPIEQILRNGLETYFLE